MVSGPSVENADSTSARVAVVRDVESQHSLDTSPDCYQVDAANRVQELRDRRLDPNYKEIPTIARFQRALDEFQTKHWSGDRITLPGGQDSVIVDTEGVGFELSKPPQAKQFVAPDGSGTMTKLECGQGWHFEPSHPRRTTLGFAHVVGDDTGEFLPVPTDCRQAPPETFFRLLRDALNPPDAYKKVPFTVDSGQEESAYALAYIEGEVVPGLPIAGMEEGRSMPGICIAPCTNVPLPLFGGLVFGLDGDPSNRDLVTAPGEWSGQSNLIIFAPHLQQSLEKMTKKDLGLPHKDQATERQITEGMFWENGDELYNEGAPFKLTHRDAETGAMITIATDSTYTGVRKKDHKTHLQAAANLSGVVEEEHAGGALVHTQRHLETVFNVADHLTDPAHTFSNMMGLFTDPAMQTAVGHVVDSQHEGVFYVHETTSFDATNETLYWQHGGSRHHKAILEGAAYILPSGEQVTAVREEENGPLKLVLTSAEGMLIRRNCTVSGGGKSEVASALITEDHPVTAKSLDGLRSEVGRIVGQCSLMDPAITNTEIYESAVKQGFSSEAVHVALHLRECWPAYVAKIGAENGNSQATARNLTRALRLQGGQVHFDGQPIIVKHLVIAERDGKTITCPIRPDQIEAIKLGVEDDISITVTLPKDKLKDVLPQHLLDDPTVHSIKYVKNSELRLFQRPDEVPVAGRAPDHERRMVGQEHFLEDGVVDETGNFIVNFELLPVSQAAGIIDSPHFQNLTPEAQAHLIDVRDNGDPDGYFCCTLFPENNNLRYLEKRPSLRNPRGFYISDMARHVALGVPFDQEVQVPAEVTMPGKRVNWIRDDLTIAVYNPLHILERPHSFCDAIACLTAKTPSSTDTPEAGIEGALTMGPFNHMDSAFALNAHFYSTILTNTHPFLMPAAEVGANLKVDHYISYLMPEVYARMSHEERNPEWLIANGYLDKVDVAGAPESYHILGHRINEKFVDEFVGRFLDNPREHFPLELLYPERQDRQAFQFGVQHIADKHREVARSYIECGTADLLCTPLKLLVHMMASDEGTYQDAELTGGAVWNMETPEFKAMFELEKVIASEEYQARLEAQRQNELNLLRKQNQAILEEKARLEAASESTQAAELAEVLRGLQQRIEQVSDPGWADNYHGTIGIDPQLVA